MSGKVEATCDPEVELVERFFTGDIRNSSGSQWRLTTEVMKGLAISEDNCFRIVWNLLIALLLVYIGTVFPYILCFWHFKVPDAVDLPRGWQILEQIVDILFYIDLVIQFIFTYTDEQGHEVYDLRKIATRYLRGFFLINAVACIPPSLIRSLVEGLMTQNSESNSSLNQVNQGLRISRLQRMSRLARLVRLARIAKLASFMKDNPVWHALQSLRGVRVLNFAVALFSMIHLLGCGWYLVASLHGKSQVEQTWLGRRAIDLAGNTLLRAPSATQWLHSVYFVFTVFTTVGFGDMAAVTNAEIIYVIFVMLVGAIFHSIIVSEMISVVTAVDEHDVNVAQQTQLLDQFSDHTELRQPIKDEIKQWISNSKGMARHRYDRERVKTLLISSAPLKLLSMLPEELFAGKLWNNDIVQAACKHGRRLPPRFPVYLALGVNRRDFDAGELVYCTSDFAFNVFLVISGIFTYVARPSKLGGIDNLTDGAMDAALLINNQVTGKRSKLSAAPEMNRDNVLSPYQIFARDKYFGECELLHRSLRRATVRCEEGGSVLVLHRNEFFSIAEEFPTIGETWRANARRHEINRCLRLQNHKRRMSVRHLAAYHIQRQVRIKISHTAYHASPTNRKANSPASNNTHHLRTGFGNLSVSLTEHVSDTIRSVLHGPGQIMHQVSAAFSDKSECPTKNNEPTALLSSETSGLSCQVDKQEIHQNTSAPEVSAQQPSYIPEPEQVEQQQTEDSDPEQGTMIDGDEGLAKFLKDFRVQPCEGQVENV